MRTAQRRGVFAGAERDQDVADRPDQQALQHALDQDGGDEPARRARDCGAATDAPTPAASKKLRPRRADATPRR